MKLGMMNDPALDPVEEARWVAEQGFDFLDLTLEGPAAGVETLDIAALAAVIADSGLGVIGHTAWYLPFGSPVKEVRAGAVEAVRATFEPLATLGAPYVSVHVDGGIRKFPYNDILRWNTESFAQLADLAREHNLKVIIENVVNNLNNAKAFKTMLNAHPDLRFHLDIAHANVKGERTADYLKAHAEKLVHVHVSDNKRTNDEHLPLGVGEIDWPEQIALLQNSGYDGTITLEVFTNDRSFLLNSATRWRQWWEQGRQVISDQ